jgi:hypothetical protein
MRPSFDFDEKVLDNADKFQDEFYKRFKLRHAPQPLQLNDKIAKNYLFPTFYGDVTSAIAIFFCSYSKAEKIMLHPKIKPVNMTKGRSLVVFSCYGYKNILGVAPYNEIAMTIPVLVDPAVNIPILPMLMKGFPRFGYYVFSMPVTSLENQIRGVKIWGLPKVVQEIDIHEDHGDCHPTHLLLLLNRMVCCRFCPDLESLDLEFREPVEKRRLRKKVDLGDNSCKSNNLSLLQEFNRC